MPILIVILIGRYTRRTIDSSHFSCHGTSFQCSWVHCQPTSEQSCRQLSWGHDDGSLQQRSVRLMEWML